MVSHSYLYYNSFRFKTPPKISDKNKGHIDSFKFTLAILFFKKKILEILNLEIAFYYSILSSSFLVSVDNCVIVRYSIIQLDILTRI